MTTGGQTVSAAGIFGSSVLGEIDRTWTSTNSFGGSVQGASSEKIFGHDNNFVLGMSVDRGLVQFTTTSELGTINADQFPVVAGSGLYIDQPSGDVAPVRLGANTLYTGFYTTDTFNVTPAPGGHRRWPFQHRPDRFDGRNRQRSGPQRQPCL